MGKEIHILHVVLWMWLNDYTLLLEREQQRVQQKRSLSDEAVYLGKTFK